MAINLVIQSIIFGIEILLSSIDVAYGNWKFIMCIMVLEKIKPMNLYWKGLGDFQKLKIDV